MRKSRTLGANAQARVQRRAVRLFTTSSLQGVAIGGVRRNEQVSIFQFFDFFLFSDISFSICGFFEFPIFTRKIRYVIRAQRYPPGGLRNFRAKQISNARQILSAGRTFCIFIIFAFHMTRGAQNGRLTYNSAFVYKRKKRGPLKIFAVKIYGLYT